MSEGSLCSSTNNNCTDDKGAKMDDGTEETNISSSSIRVKGVSDINESANNNNNDIREEENATTSNDHRPENKRKLPPWMLTQVLTQENGEIPSKRVKTAENDSIDSKVDTSNQNTDNENERINGAVVSTEDTTEEAPSCSSNLNKNNNSIETNCVDESKKENPSVDTAPENEDEPTCSSAAQIKSEPVDEQDSTDTSAVQTSSTATTNPVDIKPPIKVEKADATSTSTRESCKYGIRCYRRNPMHRIEEAHPGDDDYTRPNFPPPPQGTPDCPYGNKCYRRNPAHFQQFNHPPDTDFARNFKEFRMRLRQRQQNPNYSFDDDDSSMDEYDLDDPFIDDTDLDEDYVPSDDDIDNDDDGADGDKAEE